MKNQPNNQPSVLARLRSMTPPRGLRLAEAMGLAERQAAVLLRHADIRTGPVPIGILSALPRIQIDIVADLPSAGMSYWDGDSWRLVASAEDHPNRQRFSLMHEYKHVIDHPLRDLLYANHRQREVVADQFAASVLMPRTLVTHAWCSGEQDIVHLADLFQVSAAAMERRLLNLGLLAEPRTRRYSCARGLRTPRPLAIAGTNATLGGTP